VKFILGIITVCGCVFGGYVAMGGKMGVLWQPFEVVIIVGAAIGAMIIGNSKNVCIGFAKAFGVVAKGPKYKKAHFTELLCCLYQTLRLMKSKGVLAIESHIENPHESSLFSQFPKFQHDHHAVDFLCDYLRMISLGADNPHTMDDIMTMELEVHHQDEHQVPAAVQSMADGMPALGIVAAVLGIIKTMGSITEPPAVLGKLIGSALVGTFLGVWIAYGFLGPMALYLNFIKEQESKYLSVIKTALISHLHGNAPAISVEFARKALPHSLRPSFLEMEKTFEELPPVK
jgi:chemotaxis protein MotA